MESAATVERALDVLLHLHGENGPRGVSAIGRALAMPKSSAHRLLRSLAGRGLVEQDELGRYRPGFGLVALGLGVLDREPVVAAARPVLEETALKLGETSFLVGIRAGALVVLDKVEGNGFLRASPRVGESVPSQVTAVGKLFLALAPDQLALPSDRSSTLARAVEAAASRGYATNLDEWIPGLSVGAAPIRFGERMIAALAVAAPSARFLELVGQGLEAAVVSAGHRVEARLAGHLS